MANKMCNSLKWQWWYWRVVTHPEELSWSERLLWYNDAMVVACHSLSTPSALTQHDVFAVKFKTQFWTGWQLLNDINCILQQGSLLTFTVHKELTTTTTIVLRPVYRTTCISLYPIFKNWRILLQQSFTARMLMATSTFGLWRRC